jgi:hypothetical protein
MVKSYDHHSNERFIPNVQINSILKLRNSRLDKVYNFGIQDCCYKVELVSTWYPDQKIPCWGLNVRHKGWADHLAELEYLQPGEGASWGNDIISAFLPDDGSMSITTQEDVPDLSRLHLDSRHEAPPRPGIKLLISKLMALSKIISNTGDPPSVESDMPVLQPEILPGLDTSSLPASVADDGEYPPLTYGNLI